ncbi:MAG: S66 peptidase family protein, partial [Thermoanaerobaculia bacterium]
IGVAAISGPVDPQKLERGIAHLCAKGYGVLEAPNVRKRCGFLAGTDEERAAGYRALLCDPKVAAIFFARGGYGATRVLDRLESDELRSHPKIHLGGSDLTALFCSLQRGASLVTFYGPMVAVEMDSTEELDWEAVLSGQTPVPHTFAPEDVLAPGRGQGVLLGGCLSLLASLAGTPEALSGRGTIVFFEDTGEETYRLDRLLTQLERSGTFDGVQGLLIGSVVPDTRRESREQVREYLRDRFRSAPFPVAMDLPAGHLPHPRTLPLGSRVVLDLEGAGTLSFLDSGVA